MKLSVKIVKGQHTINTPYGMNKLVIQMLEAIGINNGEFKYQLGARIRGAADHYGLEGIKIGAFDAKTNSFATKLQPSGKDGRHRCIIYFPELYRNEAKDWYDKFVTRFGKDDSNDEMEANESQAKPEATPPEQPIPVQAANVERIVEAQQFDINAFMDDVTTSLILEEIHKRFGLESWVAKKSLLILIKSLKFEAPSNRVIGFLLRHEYLEKDPNRPEEQSRLSPKGAAKIGAHKQAEDARLTLLRKLNNELHDTEKQIQPHHDAINNLELEIEDLMQQVHEKREAQKKINEAIEELEKTITPAHASARLRILQIEELLNSPLP